MHKNCSGDNDSDNSLTTLRFVCGEVQTDRQTLLCKMLKILEAHKEETLNGFHVFPDISPCTLQRKHIHVDSCFLSKLILKGDLHQTVFNGPYGCQFI